MRLSGSTHGQWFRCRACKAVWEASAWHCVFCHDTFDHDVSAKHRESGKIQCTDPAVTLGWVKNEGRWSPPAPKTGSDAIVEVAREYQIDEPSLVRRALRWKGTSHPSSDG